MLFFLSVFLSIFWLHIQLDLVTVPVDEDLQQEDHEDQDGHPEIEVSLHEVLVIHIAHCVLLMTLVDAGVVQEEPEEWWRGNESEELSPDLGEHDGDLLVPVLDTPHDGQVLGHPKGPGGEQAGEEDKHEAKQVEVTPTLL